MGNVDNCASRLLGSTVLMGCSMSEGQMQMAGLVRKQQCRF